MNRLKKELTFIDVFCIASGSMISSGLFVLPGMAHALAGPAVVFSYFLAGLLAMTGMLSQAELVSAMPKAGGTYFYVTRSLGTAAGTIDGLLTWFSLSLKTAFALIGMAAFMKIFFTMDIRIVSLFLCFFFAVINIIGIKEAGILQRLLVLGLFSILLFYIIKGFPSVDVYHFKPFAPNGVTAVLSTTGFVFISFGGLLKISSVAEEVKDPGRIIPLGMIFSLLVVALFYTVVVFVTSGVLGPEVLDHSLTPISDGAYVLMGNNGKIMLSIAAILAFISTANAGIMSASRYPLALANDCLLPSMFRKVSKRFKTPYVSVLCTGLLIGIALFFKLNILIKLASAVLVSTFLFSCLAVIVMRESKVQNYKPQFRAVPYPWIQIIGIAGCLSLLFGMGVKTMIALVVFFLSAFLFYWFYGRIRTNREYALLHLLERITDNELTSHSLETELKEIIRERDDITKDRFDRIIEKTCVVDVEQEISIDDLFEKVADLLAKRLQSNKPLILNKFLEREKKVSSIVSKGIAIPHIIIEGESAFEIVMVRCQKGISFIEGEAKVKAVFAIAATRDERNFHLRVLAAIAQICRNRNFLRKWRTAKNEASLRDLVLLSDRMR